MFLERNEREPGCAGCAHSVREPGNMKRLLLFWVFFFFFKQLSSSSCLLVSLGV